MQELKTAFVLLVLCLLLNGQQHADVIVIDRATIIDGTGSAPIRDGAIVIEAGRIRNIGTRRDVPVPADARRIDARGKWIIPGLIDAHVHFDQSGNIYTRPDVVDLRKWRPYDKELEWIRNRLPETLARYIACGITGVVQIGGPMWGFDVRDLAARTKKAPRVAVAGPLISTINPPYQDESDPAVVQATSEDQARRLVRQQLERKPDLIKLWWVRELGDNFEADNAIYKAAADESHAHGIRVAVHATELETAKAALRIGADILVHSVDDRPVDAEFIGLLTRGNVIYVTTFIVEEGYREVLERNVRLSDIERHMGDPEVIATWSDLAKIPLSEIPDGIPRMRALPKRPISYDNLLRIDGAGGRIAAGTDAGNIGTLHGPALHRELELMANAGMRPMKIIVSATKNAAAVMGMDREIGTLETGKSADLVVLDADPLADIRNTRRIYRVMKAGEWMDAK